MSWTRVPQAVTLILDSTVAVRYGRKQAGAEVGYNPKKPGRPSHHPLLAFLQETGDLLGILWRPGSAWTGARAAEWIPELVGWSEAVHLAVQRVETTVHGFEPPVDRVEASVYRVEPSFEVVEPTLESLHAPSSLATRSSRPAVTTASSTGNRSLRRARPQRRPSDRLTATAVLCVQRINGRAHGPPRESMMGARLIPGSSAHLRLRPLRHLLPARLPLRCTQGSVASPASVSLARHAERSRSRPRTWGKSLRVCLVQRCDGQPNGADHNPRPRCPGRPSRAPRVDTDYISLAADYCPHFFVSLPMMLTRKGARKGSLTT